MPGFGMKTASGFLVSATTVEGFSETNQARILAYDKLKDKIVANRSQWGESLFQMSSSVKMIEKRLQQLGSFTHALRRGNFAKAANILRIPEPRNRHPVREVASNFLEFHLGWEPAVKDIYNSVDLIQRPIKPKLVKATAQVPRKWELISQVYTQPTYYWNADIKVLYQTKVAVSNPVLWLANTLGVVNPAQVAWQIVPFSFVVDWFVNVESFLGQLTDFWGLSTSDSFTTLSYQGITEEVWHSYYGYHYKYKWWGIARSLGLTLPSLSVRPLKMLSVARSLTAASLLTNHLKSLDPEVPATRKKRLKYHRWSVHGDL
jgi:hypothetical protein